MYKKLNEIKGQVESLAHEIMVQMDDSYEWNDLFHWQADMNRLLEELLLDEERRNQYILVMKKNDPDYHPGDDEDIYDIDFLSMNGREYWDFIQEIKKKKKKSE